MPQRWRDITWGARIGPRNNKNCSKANRLPPVAKGEPIDALRGGRSAPALMRGVAMRREIGGLLRGEGEGGILRRKVGGVVVVVVVVGREFGIMRRGGIVWVGVMVR